MTAPVRLGVLGCAGVTEYALMDILPSVPELQVTAIASRDRSKAEAFAQRHGTANVRSYDQLIADPTLEAIYIPLPNSMHCDWTIRALEAGKAVLCEKPLAANAAEAQRMVDAARRTGSILVEAFHWRYHPLSDRIVEIVNSGVLGKLQRIDVRFLLPHKMVPADNIRWSPELGGGATMDTGCYCVNFLRLLLGEPERVNSAVATLSSPQVDGRMQAEMLFRDGCIGTIVASQIEDGDDVAASAEIVGSKGALRITRPFTPHWGNRLELDIGGKVTAESAITTKTYHFQAREFANVVRHGAPIRTTASDGLANMRVIDDIYRAAGLKPRCETG